MDGDLLPQLGAGGLLGALFVVVLRMMLRADNVTREAMADVRLDRDDCHDALERERLARLADRDRCDEQIAELRTQNAVLAVHYVAERTTSRRAERAERGLPIPNRDLARLFRDVTLTDDGHHYVIPVSALGPLLLELARHRHAATQPPPTQGAHP